MNIIRWYLNLIISQILIRMKLNLIIWLIILASCKASLETSINNGAEQDEKGHITLNPEQMESIGLTFSSFEKKAISNLVKAPGYIDTPPQHKAVISPYITVFVTQIHFIVGDRVRKGQIVSKAESTEYIELQQRYLDAFNKFKNFEKDFERQQELARDNISADKQVQSAEADYKRAKTEMKGLEARLELLGTDMEKLKGGSYQTQLALRSPIEGRVVEVLSVVGKHVEPHEEIMMIMDESHLHLELKVYEEDVQKVEDHQPVFFTVPSLGQQQYKAEIYRVSKNINIKERYANAHAHIEIKEKGLLPGMYVNAWIVVSDDEVWTLPSEAVVREGNHEYIFVLEEKKGDRKVFSKWEISTGIEALGYVEVYVKDSTLINRKIVNGGSYYLSNALNEAGGHG